MHSSVLFLVSHTHLKPSDAFNYDKSSLVCFWEEFPKLLLQLLLDTMDIFFSF